MAIAAVYGFCASAIAADDLSRLKGSGEVVITSGGGTWEDAQRAAFFDPFTRDTGIKVVLVPEDHSKLLASAVAGQAEADITSLGAGLLAGFDRKGALEEINWSLFDKDTLDNMRAQFREKKGVGAFVYSIAIAFNTTRYPSSGPQPRNWHDYYDLVKFPGPRSSANCEKLVDGGVIEGALMGDGVAPDKLYPLDLDRAFKKLEAFKPNVKIWFDSGNATPDGLMNGEINIGTAWNNRIYVARKDGAPLQMSWDQSLIQYDFWVVMKHGPNTANAMKFLAYVSRAEPQAAFSDALNTGPINNAAYKLMKPERLADLVASPSNAPVQVYQDYSFWNAASADGKTNWDKAIDRCVAMLSQ